MYECYCQNKPRSEALWRQFSDCAFFQVSFKVILVSLSNFGVGIIQDKYAVFQIL